MHRSFIKQNISFLLFEKRKENNSNGFLCLFQVMDPASFQVLHFEEDVTLAPMVSLPMKTSNKLLYSLLSE